MGGIGVKQESRLNMKTSRRDFLKNMGRASLLGAIGGSVGLLLFKRRFSLNPAHVCINQGICRGCSEFDDCILPQALSARNAIDAEQATGD
jgi:hypothetical protein